MSMHPRLLISGIVLVAVSLVVTLLVVGEGVASDDAKNVPSTEETVVQNEATNTNDVAPEATGDGDGDGVVNEGANEEQKTEIATFGAGCFWGVELNFSKVEGVIDASSGYMGGDVKNPTYKQVCRDNTGHAEVVQVVFDPEVVTYEELVDLFWRLHDPTQVNRQGPDFGTQYRSVIFTHSDEQAEVAEASKEALEESGKHKRPIATIIEPAKEYWLAEEYHQDYLEKRGIESCGTGIH